MSPSNTNQNDHTDAVPQIVNQATWEAALDELRVREKAATRELDAIAAARRRLPMVELPDYTLEGPDGQVRLVDIFDGKRQLIVYNHMWFPGQPDGLRRAARPCPSRTGCSPSSRLLDDGEPRESSRIPSPIRTGHRYSGLRPGYL